MELSHSALDPLQPSMFRMLSRFGHRENSVGLIINAANSSTTAGPDGMAKNSDGGSQSTSCRRRAECRNASGGQAPYSHVPYEGGEHAMERPAKRLGGTRPMLGGRQRMVRSRSTADNGPMSRGNSENAASTLVHNYSAPIGVLSDVTNTTGQQNSLGPKQALAGGFTCPKPPALPSALPPAAAAPDSGQVDLNASPGELESDLAHAEDPQHVVEYVVDVYRALHREEALLLPAAAYMEKQNYVNAKMRAILIDWLIDVHKKYKLRPETLFLAVGIVDRFLEHRVTARRHLQLVGVTALLIAAKFEELYPPGVADFVYVTDKAYTKDEVLRMEVSILTVLDFRVCRPTAMHFLERYQRVHGCTEAHRDLAHYLLELTLIDYKMVKYSPSHVAAAAVLLSNKLLRKQPAWTPAAVRHTRFSEQMLKECAKEICLLLEQAETNPLQAVRKKFSQLKYHAVAKLKYNATQGSTVPPTSVEEAKARAARGVPVSRRGSSSALASADGDGIPVVGTCIV